MRSLRAELAFRMRLRCVWNKIRKLSLVLTVRGAPLKMKGKSYKVRVGCVMVYVKKRMLSVCHVAERMTVR